MNDCKGSAKIRHGHRRGRWITGMGRRYGDWEIFGRKLTCVERLGGYMFFHLHDIEA
jgi:hypothetical protein